MPEQRFKYRNPDLEGPKWKHFTVKPKITKIKIMEPKPKIVKIKLIEPKSKLKKIRLIQEKVEPIVELSKPIEQSEELLPEIQALVELLYYSEKNIKHRLEIEAQIGQYILKANKGIDILELVKLIKYIIVAGIKHIKNLNKKKLDQIKKYVIELGFPVHQKKLQKQIYRLQHKKEKVAPKVEIPKIEVPKVKKPLVRIINDIPKLKIDPIALKVKSINKEFKDRIKKELDEIIIQKHKLEYKNRLLADIAVYIVHYSNIFIKDENFKEKKAEILDTILSIINKYITKSSGEKQSKLQDLSEYTKKNWTKIFNMVNY